MAYKTCCPPVSIRLDLTLRPTAVEADKEPAVGHARDHRLPIVAVCGGGRSRRWQWPVSRFVVQPDSHFIHSGIIS